MNQKITPISPCPHNKVLNLTHRSKVRALYTAVAGFTLLAAVANAQVSKINSAAIMTNIIDSLTNDSLTVVSNYPSVISFSEANFSTTNTAFSPNQDLWVFASNGVPYLFQTNDYFTAYMNVTLTGSPVSPRKEAGFAFQDVAGNINGQYILDTDQGEVVAFGGNLPFYASPLDHQFVSGETITMGVTIFKDGNGNNAIIYTANGISSPVLEFYDDAVYLVNNNTTPAPYTLGGYFQIQGQSSPTTNSGSAVFQNINIITQPTLNIAQNGNQTVLYWPATSANFMLQSSTNLTSTNWANVATNGAYVIGVTVTNAAPATFYRLISPE